MDRRFVGVALIQIVLILILILVVGVLPAEILAFFALEPVLHLRLCGCNDAVVMLCMLKIVFSDDAVAGALRVAGKCRIFLGDVLRGTANFHVRT
ncbi:hypothetical protein D3C71_1833580 [compost metagenome]